ncbi:MAG: head-tail connector protein [Solobacterium sp.]|jgi:hypothetical protein|nr:head-tail connector protein [Solobacterium sp.]MCH4205292.1 head-tail connector protein [Solobacterium sp.]MCH4226885.1 head-tail connector protein [Solobacterium sp.]MCH4281645.1 head-tail connector protein [Solobacterium sp.]
MLTIDELANYIVLDIDEGSEDPDDIKTVKRLNALIKVTDEYAKSAVSADYPDDDYRVKEAQLILADDLYSHGNARSDQATARIKEIVKSMLDQVRNDLRGESDATS